MGTFREIEGDLFEQYFPAIGHGCNTVGVMGAGIAAKFRHDYPEMYNSYWVLCRIGKAEPGDIFPYEDPATGKMIYNMFSQDLPGANASLDWLTTAVSKTVKDCAIRGIKSLGIPRIGTGIGGLKWEDVRSVLERISRNAPEDFELTVVTLPTGG